VITLPDIAALEDVVTGALATGDESRLHVLGYGEISSVLAWPGADGPCACKRLPAFDDDDHFDAYRALFDEYVAALRATGVVVHESHLQTVARPDGRVVAYCVQPVLPGDALAPHLLAGADVATVERIVGTIVEQIAATIRPTLGIDAQLSNWAAVGDELVYLDVTAAPRRRRHGPTRHRAVHDVTPRGVPAGRASLPARLDPRPVLLTTPGRARPLGQPPEGGTR
jgi:hypothetical protein